MANSREYIERLQMVIQQMHQCDSTHIRTEQVHETFRGETVWRGDVEIFAVNHSRASRCYTWSHLDGKNDERTRFVAVLGAPPVTSAIDAVRVAILAPRRIKT